jgi:hypothetical protein
MVNAKGMFEAGMRGTGVDAGGECKLGDVSETLKLGGIHERADSGCKRHILFDRDSQDSDGVSGLGEFRDFGVGMLHAIIRRTWR